MLFENRCFTFADFFRAAHNSATIEPCISQFHESSKAGDRKAMIKLIMDMPCIRNAQIYKSFLAKNDPQAAEFYNKFREVIASNEEDQGEEGRAWSLLRKALFGASSNSRLFLDALLDCAKYWFGSKAFAKCLRYCECMLKLPTSFYEKTTEDASYFAERLKECIDLKQKCAKILEEMSPRIKKAHVKRSISSTKNVSSPRKSPVAVPVIDGKQHATLKSCSDAVVLRYNEKCGRHLVASRNIKAGSVLIVEQPFSFTISQESLDRNCMHCQTTLKLNDTVRIPCRHCQTVTFCSEKCRREAWQTYHRYECQVLNFFYENNSQQAPHLLLAYRMTVTGAFAARDNAMVDEPEAKFINADFLRYHTENTNKEDSLLGKSEVYTLRDYRTIVNLETNSANLEPSINLIRTIEAIFLTKCFTFVLSKMDVLCSKETFVTLAVAMLHHLQAINCNAYEIVENVLDEMRHVWEPRYVGGAIYPTVSLVNHSCYPNIVRHSYPGGTVVVRTIRFIGKGNEILDCYGPHFVSDGRSTRREYLWKKYRFICACEACADNWQYPLPETINYKCRICPGVIGVASNSNCKKDTEKKWTKQCPRCRTKVDTRKLNNQFWESVEKRSKANAMMYQGNYRDALPLLLEHNYFIEKFLAVPNIETIKTQQCIIQCYNQFGCTSQ